MKLLGGGCCYYGDRDKMKALLSLSHIKALVMSHECEDWQLALNMASQVVSLLAYLLYIVLYLFQWPYGNMPDCGVRGPRFESHHGLLLLSRQPLRYTTLGTGCAPLLQCLGRLRLPPSVGR